MALGRSAHPVRVTTSLFFGVAACSWIPHLSCHYYRLETGSSFAVGPWSVSPTESAVLLCIYAGLSTLNLLALVRPEVQVAAALVTGVGHSLFGVLHLVRVAEPFPFVVFGYPWSLGASIRESAISLGFAALCFAMTRRFRKGAAVAP